MSSNSTRSRNGRLRSCSTGVACSRRTVRPGLQSTGSVRGLCLSGSNTVSGLIPTISVAANEARGLNPDTLMALRLGPALVDGVFVTDHV